MKTLWSDQDASVSALQQLQATLGQPVAPDANHDVPAFAPLARTPAKPSHEEAAILR